MTIESSERTARIEESLRKHPLIVLLAYHALLYLAIAGLNRFVPGFAGVSGGVLTLPDTLSPQLVRPDTTEMAIAMTAAVLLALPLAYVYHHTRARKGFSQSLMQTLILLPVAVAAVTVFVKSSLALGFGLAGIVAAVRFRNTLADTKDAVHLFTAMAIGMATGVLALGAATTISFGFNLVVLWLWVNNAGQASQQFAGTLGESRVRTILARAKQGRTGSAIDEVLESVPAHAVPVLIKRAKRKRRTLKEAAATPAAKATRNRLIHVVGRASPDEIQGVVEPILRESVKRWSPPTATKLLGRRNQVSYVVRLRKRVPVEDLVAQLTNAMSSGWRADVSVEGLATAE